MRHRFVIPAVLAAVVLSAAPAFAVGSVAYAPPASRDAVVAGPDVDSSSAIVVFKQQPQAIYDGHIQGYEKTKTSNNKFNPNSAAAKKYLGYLKAEHSDFAAWLRKNVPSAKITSDFYTALNGVAVKLNGNAIGKLAQNDDVVTVEYNALYHPTMTQSVQIIHATEVWQQIGGAANAGQGVKVGVVDSGIDYRHPFFNPAGFTAPAGFPKCDAVDSSVGKVDTSCKYTSNKVIVAKTFTNKENQSGADAMPIPGIGDHGTHVSGTIAGVVMDAPDGVAGPISGVAP
jgi:minor extracellular serine protease Vpr